MYRRKIMTSLARVYIGHSRSIFTFIHSKSDNGRLGGESLRLRTHVWTRRGSCTSSSYSSSSDEEEEEEEEDDSSLELESADPSFWYSWLFTSLSQLIAWRQLERYRNLLSNGLLTSFLRSTSGSSSTWDSWSYVYLDFFPFGIPRIVLRVEKG